MIVALLLLGVLLIILGSMVAILFVKMADYDEKNKELKKFLDRQMDSNVALVKQREWAYDQLDVSRSVLNDIKDLLGKYYRGESRSRTDPAAEGE